MITVVVQNTTPLHQFNQEEISLITLGSKEDLLDKFIYKTINNG
jgi:hypothetical protein|tara:strand:+ start:89 stop:220 length:132 start_codon:yes stop_codon:yes gene_type:complete